MMADIKVTAVKKRKEESHVILPARVNMETAIREPKTTVGRNDCDR